MKPLRVWQCGACLAAMIFSVGCVGTADAGQPVRSATQQLAVPGDLVARAARALGPDSARAAATTIRAEMSGTYYALEQARTAAQPIGEAARIYRWHFDLPGGRAVREAEQLFPGGIRFSNRAAATPEGRWAVDLLKWRTGTDISSAGKDEALRERLQWERFFPHLLIEQAARAAAGVEPQGTGKFRYKDAAGDIVEVTLDPATMRPARAAQLGEGQPQTEIAFSNYVRRHGIMVPQRIEVFQSGRLQEDLSLGKTRVGRPRTELFAIPAGYSPPPAAEAPSAREIAPGILFLDNMPGNYHSLAVDLGDHLMLLEAPLNAGYAAHQKRLLQELRPGKPVRFVLVTHHHGDHTGGLNAWAEAGATIVVPQGGRIAIERQLRARGFAGAARIEEVQESRSWGTSATRVEAQAFATSHSEAHLVAYLPGPRLLFQGDLFYVPERGDVPAAFPVVSELRDLIERLGWDVQRIVGVHGRMGTAEDLRTSLLRARASRGVER